MYRWPLGTHKQHIVPTMLLQIGPLYQWNTMWLQQLKNQVMIRHHMYLHQRRKQLNWRTRMSNSSAEYFTQKKDVCQRDNMPKSNEFGTPWRSPDDDVVECSLTQCKIEHLNKLATEQCQIRASYPRTDTQQAEQRMQQHYQSASTQQVLLNVTQALTGRTR